MKMQKSMLAAVVSLLLWAGQGVALAENEAEMSDQQYCEQEAEQAGMMDAQDIKDYVVQCLAELKQMESDPESASEFGESHQGDGAEYPHLVADLGRDPAHHPTGGRFHIHRRFIRLDGEKHVAFLYKLALLLVPGNELDHVNSLPQRRNEHFGSHGLL